jgi:hypothetical protein
MLDPVFLQGSPKGIGLTNNPASAQSFTSYIKDRGRKTGFTEDVTFYSLRRRTANDLAAVLGRETARAVINHDAAGKVLEEYYLETVWQTDLGAISVRESVKQEVMDLWSSMENRVLNISI